MLEAQQSQRSVKTLNKASRLQGRSPTCKTRGRYKSFLQNAKINQHNMTEGGGVQKIVTLGDVGGGGIAKSNITKK